MDEIRIEELRVYAYHGVFPEENTKGQNFYVNVVLYTDTRKAGMEDDLAFSTDYGKVIDFICDYMPKITYKLIETVAERLAEAILLAFPLIHDIDLEIRKPEAPIKQPFSSLSVKISRGWRSVCIATGANLGDREKQIRQAVRQIIAHKQIRNVKASDLYRSVPYGGVKQPEFVNGALVLETLLRPGELLLFLQELEKQAGRREKGNEERWGPRVLDLDILLYDDVIIDSEELILPHPDMHNRDFVLRPLAQLSPGRRHPLLRKTVQQLLAELCDQYIVIGKGTAD